MIRRPPRSTPLYSSAASDVYKRQIKKIMVISMFIAGALAGIAGLSIGVGDPPPLLAKSDFEAISAGFTGIAVALLGRNTAFGVVAAALLFGALDAGAVE